MSPLRSPSLSLLVLASLTLSCDPQPLPVAADLRSAPAGVEPGATFTAAAAPTGTLRSAPAFDAQQTITVALGAAVTISGARFTPSNPEDELKLEVEWGDGQRSANGCGPCRVSHVYTAGVYQLTATVHDRRFVDRGSVTQVFTVVVRDLGETETPTSFCQPIVANGVTPTACPSGATQYCQAAPIISTSSLHAQNACSACFGVGVCVAGNTVNGGASWADPTTQTHYTYTNAVFVSIGGCPTLSTAGDITSGAGCIQGRWAP